MATVKVKNMKELLRCIETHRYLHGTDDDNPWLNEDGTPDLSNIETVAEVSEKANINTTSRIKAKSMDDLMRCIETYSLLYPNEVNPWLNEDGTPDIGRIEVNSTAELIAQIAAYKILHGTDEGNPQLNKDGIPDTSRIEAVPKFDPFGIKDNNPDTMVDFKVKSMLELLVSIEIYRYLYGTDEGNPWVNADGTPNTSTIETSTEVA